MGATSGHFTPPYIPTPDNHKQLWSSTIAFDAGSVAAVVVNPPNLMQAATIYNMSNLWMRATVVYPAGVLFDGPPTEHCMLVPPFSSYDFDLSLHDGSGVPGTIAPIESMYFNFVILGTTTQGSNGLVEIAHPTGAVNVINFVTN
jgi:hypothetical protein